jgi:hypothetical protein
MLGFLSGVIAFLSGLIMTMTWLHFSVPLCLNVIVSSFLLMLCFMILATASIMALVVLKMDVCCHTLLILGRSFLNTMKSTGTKEFPILTEISSTHDCFVIRELDRTSGCQSDKRRLEHLSHPSYQVCIADVLGRSLPKVFFILLRPRFCLNLSLGFLFLFNWISWTHLLGFCFGFSQAIPEQYP